MKSPKLVQVFPKNMGLPRSSMGKLAGGIEVTLSSKSLLANVLTMFGYLSARLFNSHGSAMTSNKHGLLNGLQFVVGPVAQVTVAFLRSSLKMGLF